MKTIRVPRFFGFFGAAFAIAGLQFSSAVLPSAYAEDQEGKAKAKFFDWENLQSDVGGVADRTDPNLVNPWGLAVGPTWIFWVADNHTGVYTIYATIVTPNTLVSQIQPSSG